MLIAQITDIHLGFDPDNPREFNRIRLDRTLAQLVHMEPRPDLLLATGDLVDRGDEKSYRHLKDAFSGLPFPVHMCLGNHDSRANFRKVFAGANFHGDHLQYEIAVGPLRLLVLDTLEEGRHGGAFDDVRAEWLNTRLSEKIDMPTIIVQHHPPVEVGIAWMNTDPREPWVARLAACLQGRDNVIAMLCGHVHRPIMSHWQGMAISICPATAPQVALNLNTIDPANPDNRDMIIADPPGYALHWWNGRELVSHFGAAEENETLARYDERMQLLVSRLVAERPKS